MATSWRFRLPTGQIIAGPIQGAGGTIEYGRGDGARHMEAFQRRARQGDPLGCYEPEVGCVSMHTPEGRLLVDLRSAEFVGVAPVLGSTITPTDIRELATEPRNTIRTRNLCETALGNGPDAAVARDRVAELLNMRRGVGAV